MCAAMLDKGVSTKPCGPTINAFCPWSRLVDQCCLKDIDQATTLSLSGTCADCSSVTHDTLNKRLWTYDASNGWT